MIRILQQNNKATKVIFAVIIGFAVVTMVITLVPGIFDNVGSSSDPNTFATVHEPGFIGKVFGETQTVTRPEIARAVQQQMQGRQIPPYLMPYFESQAGNQLVQLAILKIDGDRRGLGSRTRTSAVSCTRASSARSSSRAATTSATTSTWTSSRTSSG